MKKLQSAGCLATLIAFGVAGCGSDPDCGPLLGTYSGTLSGNAPYRGTLTFVVTEICSGPCTSAALEGTWTGEDGYFGNINRTTELDCESGTVKYDFGFDLQGPDSVVCPPPNCPSSDTGCYCSGATLGEFAGTVEEDGGSGTFQVDSGAAEYLGQSGGGTWSVQRE